MKKRHGDNSIERFYDEDNVATIVMIVSILFLAIVVETLLQLFDRNGS